MKNLSLYNNNLSVPRKQDVDGLTKRVDDAEAQLVVLDSDISSIEGDITNINGEIGKKLNTPTGTKGQLLGFTANNVVGAVDVPLTSGSYFNKKFEGTLGTTWEGASAPFYQQFTIADITDTVCPLVFPQIATGATAEQTAWNSINGQVESFNGYVRFYTNVKTTTPVKFVLYYGNLVNPSGGEAISLIDNTASPVSVRNGSFFEDVK